MELVRQSSSGWRPKGRGSQSLIAIERRARSWSNLWGNSIKSCTCRPTCVQGPNAANHADAPEDSSGDQHHDTTGDPDTPERDSRERHEHESAAESFASLAGSIFESESMDAARAIPTGAAS